MLPVDPVWFPFLTTFLVLLVVFVAVFARHIVVKRRQLRARPQTPGTPEKVPEEVAWDKGEAPAIRACMLMALAIFPGIPIYLVLWGITTTIAFGQLDGERWQSPTWWALTWTVVWLTIALCYVFQPWRYADLGRTRAPVSYPDNWDELRRAVYARDRYQCRNCGATDVELHAHHIVPLSVGGTNADTNLVTLCRDCHQLIHPHMRD